MTLAIDNSGIKKDTAINTCFVTTLDIAPLFMGKTLLKWMDCDSAVKIRKK